MCASGFVYRRSERPPKPKNSHKPPEPTDAGMKWHQRRVSRESPCGCDEDAVTLSDFKGPMIDDALKTVEANMAPLVQQLADEMKRIEAAVEVDRAALQEQLDYLQERNATLSEENTHLMRSNTAFQREAAKRKPARDGLAFDADSQAKVLEGRWAHNLSMKQTCPTI